MSPQLQQALEFLTRTLSESERKPRSIKELAKDAGVAYTTMWKAVQVLKYDGVIRAAPRRGLTRVSAPVSSSEPPRPRSSHHIRDTVATRLRSDILRGVYSPGQPLHSRKEMAQRYGVCRATLANVLHDLHREGWLRMERRRLVVRQRVSAQAKNRALLVCAGGDNGLPLLPNPRSSANLRVLEYECNVRNLGIDYALVVPETGDLENPRAIYRRMNEPTYPAHLAGILIWQTGIDKPDWSMLVSRFQSLGKSMALFEEAGEHPLPRALWAKPGVRLYEAGFSALSGKEMGRFLLRMGHRRIAYLSPVHGSRWSQNRLQGIREAYREAGLPDGVRALVHEPYVLPSDTLSYQMGLLDEIGGRLAHRSDPEHTLSSRLVSETLRSLSIHAPLVLQRKAYEEHVVPLMEAAYADRSLTAWVGAEDDTAIPCLRFLQEHGMAVPEDVSVVGFDDSLESFMHRLTSYNYDGPAYVRMMLSHVLSPGSPESGGVGNHPVELPGTVVIRQSVGPPPNSGT